MEGVRSQTRMAAESQVVANFTDKAMEASREFRESLLRTGGWLAALIMAFALSGVLERVVSDYWFKILIFCGINIILAVSLNLVNGFTGQFSIGHAGFMAVGGYVASVLTMYFRDNTFSAGVPVEFVFPLGLVAGGAAAAAAGYLVGMPSLRLRGDYLAIVTLGFGEIIRVVIMNTDSVGGASGLNNIPPYTSFGWVYSAVVMTLFCIWRVVNSVQGRSLMAVREDEIAGEAMGVNTTQTKVRAFAMGAFFAGVAGGLYAHEIQILTPQTFNFNKSFEIVIMVVLGGMGSISGSVVAAILLTIMPEALRSLQGLVGVDLRMIVYSLVLIVLMLTRPNGLFGTREILDYFPRRKGTGSLSQASSMGGKK